MEPQKVNKARRGRLSELTQSKKTRDLGQNPDKHQYLRNKLRKKEKKKETS